MNRRGDIARTAPQDCAFFAKKVVGTDARPAGLRIFAANKAYLCAGDFRTLRVKLWRPVSTLGRRAGGGRTRRPRALK